jgi:periplasmic protein TonB
LKTIKLAIYVVVFSMLAGGIAHALEPNGTSAYNELGSRLYLGTLLLETPSQDAKEILASTGAKQMEIRFSDQMSKRRWDQTWKQSIAINAAQDTMVAAAAELSQTLDAFQGTLEYGDIVTIGYDPLYGTSVVVNGVKIVQEKSLNLFNLFLSAWIGPVPPNSQFKADMLGQSSTANTYTEFLAISPSQDRVDVVKSWNTDLKAEEERRLAEAKAEAEAEAEAMRKAEEEAEQKATAQAMEDQKRLALIEEEKRKAQEAAQIKAEQERARKLAEEKAAKEAAAAQAAQALLAQQQYSTSIIAKIYKSVRYPSKAVKRNLEGSARANVTLDRGGNVTNVEMLEITEHELLNEAVSSAISKAAPFPPIPDAIADTQFDIIVPITFKLN